MTIWKPANDEESKHGLDIAKRKLESGIDRPFDLDKNLAVDRARREREQASRHAAEAKLETELKAARKRRHELRARETEKLQTDSELQEIEAIKKALEAQKHRSRTNKPVKRGPGQLPEE